MRQFEIGTLAVLMFEALRRVSTTLRQVFTEFSELFMCWIVVVGPVETDAFLSFMLLFSFCAYPQFSAKKFRARIA